MGMRLTFLSPLEVTTVKGCSGLLDCPGGLRSSRKQPQHMDRTRNRHRWMGRVYQGARENGVEGTRQIDPVTSGEGVPLFGQPEGGGTDQGVATVY
jgi:hypothetical protein